MANKLMLSHSVGEALIHVIHPVADQALKHIIDKLGYHDLFKDNIDVRTDFRQWSKTGDKSHSGSARGNRVRAKLTTNVNPATIKWEGSGTTIDLGNGNTLIQNNNSSRGQRNPHMAGNYISNTYSSIMRDDQYGIDLSDRMIGSSLSMEVTMEFEDEHMGTEAISRIFQCFSNGDMIGYIDLLYDVPVPENIQTMLRYLYHLECLTTANPNGAFDPTTKKFKSDEWYKWLQDKSGKVITSVQNRNRPEHIEMVVNKSHFQALYLLECSQESPTPLDPEGSGVTFNLTVQYARSNRMILEYPVIVNNNYVEQKFVPMERQIRAAGPESMIMWQNPNVTKLWHQYFTLNKRAKPVMFPFWDPWMVPTDSRVVKQNYQQVLIAAFTLDDVDNPSGVTKFDFDTDLGEALGCRLDQNIVYTMRKYKNECFGASRFVNISVFSDDLAIETDFLDFSDGHTLTIKNRKLGPIYRMVISVDPKKLVWQTIYKKAHEFEAAVGKTYYWYNRGEMTKLKIHPWRALNDIRATHGDLYTLYDQDETIYEASTDTIAQIYTVYYKRATETVYAVDYDETAQTGKEYFVKVGETYTKLSVEVGASLTAYRQQYGTIYTTMDVFVYTPLDTVDGQDLTPLIQQYGTLYNLQETRPEPEYLTFSDNRGYRWNRVWISAITAHYPAAYPAVYSVPAQERKEHGIWHQNR